MMFVPEDGGKDRVHGKGAAVEVVDVPDLAVDRVPDRDEDGQEPCEQAEDLVGGDGGGRVRLAPTEGVH